MEDCVDKVCRHAGYVVRSLGTDLWRRLIQTQAYRCEQGECDPPAVRKKNFTGDFPVRRPQLFSTGMSRQPVDIRAHGSPPAGAAELITFDGVFDRRVCSPARG